MASLDRHGKLGIKACRSRQRQALINKEKLKTKKCTVGKYRSIGFIDRVES